ncbi:HNH endonuclease [Candidatus Bathyarchaeota archaeon]|nr:HNH endonuclease [Candidatus Bathyarchaeota archaeon]
MERKATIWWALYRYFPGLQGRISSNTVNKPENAMTLGAALHLSFNMFAIAFNPSVCLGSF